MNKYDRLKSAYDVLYFTMGLVKQSPTIVGEGEMSLQEVLDCVEASRTKAERIRKGE